MVRGRGPEYARASFESANCIGHALKDFFSNKIEAVLLFLFSFESIILTIVKHYFN